MDKIEKAIKESDKDKTLPSAFELDFENNPLLAKETHLDVLYYMNGGKGPRPGRLDNDWVLKQRQKPQDNEKEKSALKALNKLTKELLKKKNKG